MKNIIKSAIVILLALSFGRANAQTSGDFLLTNPDAHVLGMANTGAAMYATPFAMWNNTSSTLFSENRMDIGASYGMWNPAGSSSIAVAGYGRIAKFMTISAGFKHMGYKPYPIADASGRAGDEFKPGEWIMGVGLGFKILPILSASANINYLSSSLAPEVKGGAFSADFGATLDLKFLRVGVTASNIGSKLKYSEESAYALPANVQLGVGTTQYFGAEDKHALTANVQAGMTFASSAFVAAIGAEYKWNDMVRVAAGYHYGDIEKGIPSYASVGLGVKFIGISLNGAYLLGIGDSPVGNTFTVGLGYSF